MKTLFFIAALAGAVYLIMQTPAGQAWLEESEPEVNMQQQTQEKNQNKIQVAQQISAQAMQLVENKVTEIAQNLNQQQQTQINQLENRIAELENELVMGRVGQNKHQGVPNEAVNEHPNMSNDTLLVATPYSQDLTQNSPATAAPVATLDNTLQLQRKRQARLQDIAEKMEMSSLQALVN